MSRLPNFNTDNRCHLLFLKSLRQQGPDEPIDFLERRISCTYILQFSFDEVGADQDILTEGSYVKATSNCQILGDDVISDDSQDPLFDFLAEFWVVHSIHDLAFVLSAH